MADPALKSAPAPAAGTGAAKPGATPAKPGAAPPKPGAAPAAAPTQAAGTAPAGGAAPEGTEAGGLLSGAEAADALLKEAGVEGAEAGADGGKADDKGAPAGAPEKYELKVPENGLLPAGALARIEADARARGLTNEAAQAMVADQNTAISEYMQDEASKFKAQQAEWRKAIATDKVLGGPKLKENMALVAKYVKDEVPPEIQKFLQVSGLDANDHVFRWLHKLAKPRATAKEVLGGGQPPGQEVNLTPEQRMLKGYERTAARQQAAAPGRVVKEQD